MLQAEHNTRAYIDHFSDISCSSTWGGFLKTLVVLLPLKICFNYQNTSQLAFGTVQSLPHSVIYAENSLLKC